MYALNLIGLTAGIVRPKGMRVNTYYAIISIQRKGKKKKKKYAPDALFLFIYFLMGIVSGKQIFILFNIRVFRDNHAV